MIKVKNCICAASLFGLNFVFFLLLSCWSRSPNALPEAPPPYPDSPYSQGSQIGTYAPPPSPSPYGNNYPKSKNSYRESFNKNTTQSSGRSYDNLYSLEAISTIWILVQDKFGNELQWISLMAGEKVPIDHSGPLTITCSSGESLKITDPKGKPFQVGGKNKGITIIRLP